MLITRQRYRIRKLKQKLSRPERYPAQEEASG
jgi:hypothetical protein